MTDIRAEDVQRLTDLANALAEIRRDLRHTARRPPAKVPDLLAQNITALADYVATASRMRAELSHRTGPAVANVGEDWGPTFAATRASPVLHKLTELLDNACDLANQVRPRGTTRSHFYSPGLDGRVAQQFAEADEMLTHTISTIRRFRTGLGQVRRRELDREQQALADPDGPAARMLAARAQYRRQPLVIVPHGFAQEAATAGAASRQAGASKVVSHTPAPDAASTHAPGRR
ncbi:hypothetical protein GCM10010430_60420 [Kitasatospora cystarginea]|uniref:Uncharacterized protein n=1 Tax=Kitasatospora cystarginea TaxID=58350 RepID=A0ABP5RNA9_9ACTN